MVRGPSRDPEQQRIDELTERVRDGVATEAEREELALYAEERAELLPVARADAGRGPDGEWLARVAADRQIEAAEKTRFVVAERAVGMTLTAAGLVGALIVPPLGMLTVIGLGILGFSVFRVRARTALQDPYKDIEK